MELPLTASVSDRWTIGPDKGFTSPCIEAFRNDVAREFARFARVPPDRLSWVTIIGQPMVVNHDVDSALIVGAFDDLARKLLKRCKRQLPGMRLRGVFEADLLRGGGALGRHKAGLLDELGIDHKTITSEQRVLVPHIHFVVDRGAHLPSRLKDQLAGEFPGPRRVMVKPLFDAVPVRTNLETLAGYCCKLKPAYSLAWQGRLTKFGEVFEPVWIEMMVRVIRSLDVYGLYFTHGCNGIQSINPDGNLTVGTENHEILRPTDRSTAIETGTAIDEESIPAMTQPTHDHHGSHGAIVTTGVLHAKAKLLTNHWTFLRCFAREGPN